MSDEMKDKMRINWANISR